MSSIYSIGQMNQLADRLELEGFTSDDITKLGQHKNISAIRGLLRGTHEIKQVKHIIDCDADPFCPEGWKVEKHLKGGQLEWNLERISIFLSEEQKNGEYITGGELRKRLEYLPVLNVNVLDYLLDHKEIIPKEWKDKKIYFWGTVYINTRSRLIVRCLCGKAWGVNELVCGFGVKDFSALLF